MANLEYLIEYDGRLVKMSDFAPVKVELVDALHTDLLGTDGPSTFGAIAQHYCPEGADAYAIRLDKVEGAGCPGPGYGSGAIDFYRIVGK